MQLVELRVIELGDVHNIEEKFAKWEIFFLARTQMHIIIIFISTWKFINIVMLQPQRK